MAATFNKFQDFAEQLGKGLHHLHAAGDTLKVFLTNEAPLATDTVKTDMAEISGGGATGYTAGGQDAQNDLSESGGTATLTCVDIVWTAGSSGMGPFRYAVLYNDTNASDALVAWWDYESSISLGEGETFTVNFGASVLTIA